MEKERNMLLLTEKNEEKETSKRMQKDNPRLHAVLGRQQRQG